MKKQTRSILHELNSMIVEKDRQHVMESRATNVIESAINLIDQIDEYYSPNTSLLSSFPTSESAGVTHGTTIPLTAPNTMRITFHSGKIDQTSDNTLTSIAVSPKFKRQTDYYTGDEEYWSPQHRLLDTAYTVSDVEIATQFIGLLLIFSASIKLKLKSLK